MRATEFIAELFDSNKAVPHKWTSLTQAKAQLPDGRFLTVNFRPVDPKNSDYSNQPWSIEFSVNDEFEITGGGGVNTIFATVIEVIKHFAEAFHNIPALYFTAEERSRARMYDTLAKRVAQQIGWHVVPYDEMMQDPKYQTPLSYGDFMFAIEPGTAPEHRQDAQRPQHGEFLPIYYVHSAENKELPAIKLKAKAAHKAEEWVIKNVPEYKNEHPMAVMAYKKIPQNVKIIDMGTVTEPKKPEPQDPNSLGAKLRAKLDSQSNTR
jgi:hypothetical protein